MGLDGAGLNEHVAVVARHGFWHRRRPKVLPLGVHGGLHLKALDQSPEGSCTPVSHTLALKCCLCGDFGAQVHDVGVHGPSGELFPCAGSSEKNRQINFGPFEGVEDLETM